MYEWKAGRYLNSTEEKDQRLFESTNLKKTNNRSTYHIRENSNDNSVHTFAIGLESQRRVSAVFARLNDAAFYIRSACKLAHVRHATRDFTRRRVATTWTIIGGRRLPPRLNCINKWQDGGFNFLHATSTCGMRGDE